jgi:PAS domain S-box-containing protein
MSDNLNVKKECAKSNCKLNDSSLKSILESIDFLKKIIENENIELVNKSKLKDNELKIKFNTLVNNLEKYKDLILNFSRINNFVYDGIFITDSSGVVVFTNKAYSRITGINAEEILGEQIETLIEKKFFTRAVTADVIKEKKCITYMSTILRNNKKVLVTGSPIFNENNELIQVVTNVRDISELIDMKEKLEETERKTRIYEKELIKFRTKQNENSIIVGKQSACMQRTIELTHKVAQVDSTVLIMGETGVGKEIIAREIYLNSQRAKAPFIKVNCAAIPLNLLESELFGYEKGAFTGALNKDKKGLFELANHGTILLDEIGEMPLNLQSKLLRVLQEKEIKRVGGTASINLNVRVIASTNKNLKQEVNKKLFREDLYYRLNVVPIKVPTLRERKEDISLLANYFLNIFNTKYNKDKILDLSILRVLTNYKWPGNVRELKNLIERFVVIVDEKTITDKHFNSMVTERDILSSINTEGLTLKEAVESLERRMIENALKTHGTTRKTAKILGIDQSNVVRKAKKLGIPLK